MIDKSKQYKTRDGRGVRIYATDGVGKYQVHGAFLSDEGWLDKTWTSDGKNYDFNSPSQLDLIEVKPRIRREFWVNVYDNHVGLTHKTKAEADDSGYGRIACVRVAVDCEEGEGLED